MIFGITGGIASGKSTASARFCEVLQAQLFDADAEARRLLDEDPQVQRDVISAFGRQVIGRDGRADRPLLRQLVFADAGRRRALEEILHPRVRLAWQLLARDHLQKPGGSPLILDIPLLYETGADAHIDRVVVVGCLPETQLQRLIAYRRLDEPTARRIISAQLPLSEKAARATHLLWNDGSPTAFQLQIDLLAVHLQALAAADFASCPPS
ncbi:MAG: dephospho-CoA kinase [Verrucomicrobia bacterium]|nr:dephospho-CoA kinase [Verrucomicrobiota bacterium]